MSGGDTSRPRLQEEEEELRMNEKHLGSDFDDFLREEALLEQAEAVAARRVQAYRLPEAMKEQQLSKGAIALRLAPSVPPRLPSSRAASFSS